MGYLDRYGEPINEETTETGHDPNCVDGWLGENERGQIIPCLTCRPHRAKQAAR